jgi:hypothetical protein
MNTMLQPFYHPLLVCHLLKIECGTDWLIFYFPRLECCDMEGAIKFALSINPKVRLIMTWSGRKKDTFYRLNDGKWSSSRPKTAKSNS